VVSLGDAMITTRNIVWVLVLGSVWGVAELFGRDLLSDLGVGGGTVWLTAWAILVLSIGRGLWIGAKTAAMLSGDPAGDPVTAEKR
jgi:hypothetical protein